MLSESLDPCLVCAKRFEVVTFTTRGKIVNHNKIFRSVVPAASSAVRIELFQEIRERAVVSSWVERHFFATLLVGFR